MDMGSTIAIADGVRMPRLGFGTYKASEGGEVEAAVSTALEVGYRSIDTASMYHNETGVGRAIRDAGVPRERIFLATKAWNDEQGREGPKAALARSLERLGTDYVDLYLVHWPIPELMADTWRAMEELHAEGSARAIGVCNHLEHHLDDLLAVADVPPAVDQVEFHPRLQQPGLQAYCRERGIVLEAWAPIMRARVLDIAELVEIGEAHGKTAVQVTLRWILQKGHVAIPKSVHESYIRQNADVFDFELAERERETNAALDTGERLGPHPDHFAG